MKDTLIFKIPFLPDTKLPKYTSKHQDPVSSILDSHNEFFIILTELAKTYNIRFSIRYSYSPEKDNFDKLEVFLVFKSENTIILNEIKKVLISSSLSEFYKFEIYEPKEDDNIFYNLTWVNSIIEAIKKEEKILPLKTLFKERTKNKLLSHYYYINKLSAKSSNNMNFLIKALNNFNKKVVFDLTLEPTNLTIETFKITQESIDTLKNNSFNDDYIQEITKLINIDFVSLKSFEKAINELDLPHITLAQKNLIVESSQTTSEREVLERLISLLNDLLFINISEKELVKNNQPNKYISDFNVSPVKSSFEEIIQEYLKEEVFLYSIKFLSEDEFTAKMLMSNFIISSTEDGKYRPLLYNKENKIYNEILSSYLETKISKKSYWKEYWNEYAESKTYRPLARIHRLISSNEVKGFFRLAIPDRTTTIQGIPLETDILNSSKKPKIEIGQEEDRIYNSFFIDLNQLSKHMFVVGVPGSGKTTALINILIQLWCDYKIPFIVIEPAKTEYRTIKFINTDPEKDLKNKFGKNLEFVNDIKYLSNFIETSFPKYLSSFIKSNIDSVKIENEFDFWNSISNIINLYTKPLREDSYIITLGKEELLPFRFNPFQIIEGVDLFEHISNLEQSFRSSIDLGEGGPLPALLVEAISDIYHEKGWRGGKFPQKGNLFPTMQDLYEKLESLIESKGYDKEIKGNLRSALEIRIGTFLTMNTGKMLNTQKMFPPIEDILSKPIIIELDALNEYQANLITMFLLTFIQEYVKVNRISGTSLKHVVLIEEAHNIIGKSKQKDGVDTKAEATKLVVKMLAEMRALGEGFIIADQLPSAVSDSAIKNTNIKLAHRIVSQDDIEILFNSMALDPNQIEKLPRFKPGQSVMYQEGWYNAKNVIEPDTKSIYGISDSISNSDLYTNMKNNKNYLDLIGYISNEEKLIEEELLEEIKNLYQSELNKLIEFFDFNPYKDDISILKQKYPNIPSFLSELNSGFIQEINSELNSKLQRFLFKLKKMSLTYYIENDYELKNYYDLLNTSIDKLKIYQQDFKDKVIELYNNRNVSTDLKESNIYNDKKVFLNELTNNISSKIEYQSINTLNSWYTQEKIEGISKSISFYTDDMLNILILINNVIKNLCEVKDYATNQLLVFKESENINTLFNSLNQEYEDLKSFMLNIVMKDDFESITDESLNKYHSLLEKYLDNSFENKKYENLLKEIYTNFNYSNDDLLEIFKYLNVTLIEHIRLYNRFIYSIYDVLFHNPEEVSEENISIIKNKVIKHLNNEKELLDNNIDFYKYLFPYIIYDGKYKQLNILGSTNYISIEEQLEF